MNTHTLPLRAVGVPSELTQSRRLRPALRAERQPGEVREVAGPTENNVNGSIPEEGPLCDYDVDTEPTQQSADESGDAIMGIDIPTVEAEMNNGIL